MTITSNEYKMLDEAFEHFNKALFNGALPQCLITLQRKSKRNFGYFHSSRFFSRVDGTIVDEIALNPDNYQGRDDKWILSVLVHEIAHLWQATLGDQPRGGYHDRQWGRRMEELGLIPSNTGEPGGKKTGQQMQHYIVDKGPFDVACDAFLKSHALTWMSKFTKTSKTNNSKVNYACNQCDQKAWAKPGAHLICGDCMEPMEMTE